MEAMEIAAIIATVASTAGILKFMTDIMERLQRSAVNQAQMASSIELLHCEIKEGFFEVKVIEKRLTDLEFWAAKSDFVKR